jgi:uncharacterized protein YacL
MPYSLIIPMVAVAVLIVCYIAIRLMRLSLQKLILITVGFIFGALSGALISLPIDGLPEPYSTILPITITLMAAIAMAEVFYHQHHAIGVLFPRLAEANNNQSDKPKTKESSRGRILVDTSAIIDGRIADIAATGFVPGKLLVPRFVLAELQNIADSEDPLRRSKGRRGLELLNKLRESDAVELDITNEDPKKIKEVDHKLVYLAKKFKTDILTTDYNLNRVATIESVRVLNMNELSQALRAVVLPGEILVVRVVQTGKEKGQGVGYLDDGTMIVVEGGDKIVGQEVETEVTRIFQTVAGKMIFATPRKNPPAKKTTRKPTKSSARSANKK